jgi:stage IV sporulation protein FB
MTWSFPIGRLFGSELRVHATFFLLLAWIGASAYSMGGATAALDQVLFVVLLFACVVAHEFGHALTARRYGIRTPDITVLPIGGLARLERMPEKPGQEIAVALAGPAVNVVIWAALSLIVGGDGMRALLEDPTATGNIAARLAAVNLALALFNLIPAFPMDGGRVLRAALALKTDRVKATRIAASAGQIMAFLFALWGLTTGNLILLLIAVFIFLAAQGEANDVAQRDLAKGLFLRDAMITQFETLAPTDTLHAAGQALIRTTQHEFPVIDRGTLCGFLTRQALFVAMAEGHTQRPVSEVMLEEIPTMALNAPLSDVLTALHEAPAVAGMDRHGHMLGYVTSENLGELMVLRQRAAA